MATNPIFPDVPAWPEPQAAPAHIGHNKPPIEEIVPEEFRAELLRERPDFLTTLDKYVDAAERAHAEDDDGLKKCGDLVNGYRAILKHIDATHKTVKQPYLDGGRAVDAEKNALTARVNEAKGKVEKIGNDYVAKREAALRAERERIAEQERAAARAAMEAEERARAAAATANPEARAEAEEAAEAAYEAMEEAHLAGASIAKTEPVRSDAGATVSGKQEWRSQVEDYTKAFHKVKTDPKVRDAIDAAVARLVRAGTRELAGVRIWPVARANFR